MLRCDTDLDVKDGTLCRWQVLEWTREDAPDLRFIHPPADGPSPPARKSVLPELGALSARHESNGKPGAIGYDTTGVWSYGTYQIATKTHTFKSFMHFLKVHYADFAQVLEGAGGIRAATQGKKKFRHAWVKLAKEKALAFKDAQHGFIKTTHYDVQVNSLKEDYALDVNARSRALQNVVWSMAVQHGDGTQTIFENVLKAQPKGTKLTNIADADLIHLLYVERSKVEKYFKHSTKGVKAGVKKRFEQEEKEALKMLREEGGIAPSKASTH